MKTITLFWHLTQYFLEWEMYQTKVVEKIKTHILRSISSPPPLFEKRALYEIMLKNIVQRDTSQTAIWRMRMACWIPKATDTLSEYVIHIAFPL